MVFSSCPSEYKLFPSIVLIAKGEYLFYVTESILLISGQDND